MAQADEELLHKHQALILAATGDGVYGLDVAGRTTFVNPAAERLTGYSSEEMLGKGQHALIHHTHADGTHYPKLECPIYAAFKDGKVHRDSSEVFWRKDGSSFPVEYISTPILDDGVIVGAVVSFRDITVRKQAETAQLESEKRYRKIFNATHDAIFLLRADDGAILDANEEACRMLGYPHDVLTAMNSAEIHPQEIEELGVFLKMVLDRGKWRSDSLSCLSGSGERIPARLSASVITLQGCDCILVLAQDLREFYKAEKRARKLQADLHHVSRLSAMGEMASGMAHELNQPLTAVMNYLQACQLILDTGTEEQREKISGYMGKAIDQAERAGNIISGLRTFVQKSETNRTFEDLNEIVVEASALLHSGATTEDIDFKIERAGGLPRICVDKIQIQQVVFNLVRNGVEALADTKIGQITVFTSQESDASVKVSVSDNGSGVGDDMLDKLFDAFTTTKADGMGVGLSICQSIVADHGGKIRADRNPGGGMTFAFTLPTAAREDVDA